MTERKHASSPAVAERPRDASRLSVVGLNSTIRRSQSSVISCFRFRFTAAYTNKFCFVLFVVVVHAAGCDTQRFTDVCGKLYGGRSHLLFALQPSLIDGRILVENRDLCLPHLHSTSPLRWSPSEYRHTVWHTKTRMVWLPEGEKSLRT